MNYSIALYLIVLVVVGLSSIQLRYLFKFRGSISTMVGMMIAMGFAMSIGLLFGLISGVIFSGNLFLSTVFAMLLGLLTGIIFGLPVSIMAVLDGVLAGLMGGMMGAMLGEMLSIPYRESMTQIMFLVSVVILLTIVYMTRESLSLHLKVGSWFHNPIVISIVLLLFFLSFNQFGPIYSSKEDQKQITIIAKEYQFVPNKIIVQVGQTISIELQNEGHTKHDLEILGLQVEQVQYRFSHQHSANNIHLHTSRGEKNTVTFVPMKIGTYRVVCTLPDHLASGMEGTMIVQ